MTYYDPILDTSTTEVAYAPAKKFSLLAPALLAIPVLLSLFSWLSGGMPAMTDAAFAVLVLILCFNLVRELMLFPARQGLARLTLYGGSLVWFCHDYFVNFFNADFNGFLIDYPAVVVAKGAFYTCLFILFADVGTMLPTGGWMEKITLKLPTPSSLNMYLAIVAVAFVIGISPYFLFTSDPFFIAIYRGITAMRGGVGTAWTVSGVGDPTGWGKYIVHLMHIGEIGAIFGMFVVVMLRPGPVAMVLCGLNWVLWTLLAFGTGSRGPVLAMALPVVGMIFVKYAGLVMAQIERHGRKVFVRTGVLMFIVLVLVQVQGTFRGEGLSGVELSELNLTKNQGNTMFTESLISYQLFPDQMPHPRNRFPGEGAIRFYPDTILRFGIGWIPRAIWANKPGMDDVQLMINQMMTGGTATGIDGTGGGTIANGITGYTYLRYGGIAVLQVALLFGWLAACAEGTMRVVMNRPFALLITLGFATYLFRAFRDLTPHDLYPLLVGALGVVIVCKVGRIFSGDVSQEQAVAYE